MVDHDRVDDGVVFGVFRGRLGDFDRFGELVRQWVKGQPG